MNRLSHIPWRNLLPNSVTLLAMLAGFVSIVYTMNARYVPAAWWIFFAGTLDMFDGGVARRLGSDSVLGKQLDSLSDLVSCAVAPAVLVYATFFRPWGIWGALLSFCWLAFAASRLARFMGNTQERADHFQGFPSPVAASFPASCVIFAEARWGAYPYPELVATLLLVFCYLMVSTIPYPKSFYLVSERILTTWQGWGALFLILIGTLFPTRIGLMALIYGLAPPINALRKLVKSRPA